MNVYFLVEGKRTERKIYPRWLSILVPELKFVDFFDEIDSNSYKIFSGDGFPHLIHKHLKASIEDVNEDGNYDYFVICLDSDDCSVEARVNEVHNFLNENDIKLNENIEFRIIVQNKCIESWLLGNRNIFKSNPTDTNLVKAIKFYNVSENDPEFMEKPDSFAGSTADFHYHYIKGILAERNISYTKRNPRDVVEEHYLKQLIKRSQETNHIKSFTNFIEFCAELNSRLT